MNWTIATDIADRIRELRDLLGSRPNSALSQEELGKRAGVRASQVSQWERGGQQPSRSRLERWADREGWPVTVFASGSPQPSEVLLPGGASRDAQADDSATDLGTGGGMNPDHILAHFYRLMATAAEQGKPWPGELAELMDQMYRVTKGKPASPAGSAVDETGSSNVPAW